MLRCKSCKKCEQRFLLSTIKSRYLDAHGKYYTWERSWLPRSDIITRRERIATRQSRHLQCVQCTYRRYYVHLKKTKENSQISSATAIERGSVQCTRYRCRRGAATGAGPQPRCQSQLLFLLPAQADNGGKMFCTCGDERGVGSIAGALISVGIVRINGSYCRVCCLFPQFLVPLLLVSEVS